MRRLQAALARAVARWVGRVGRERLTRVLARPLPRRLVLGGLFGAMARAVRRSARERENVVVEWRVTGAPDGEPDVRQLVIGGGRAGIERGRPRDADMALTIAAADLVLVATGNAAATALFVSGAIRLEGDPWLAMRLPRMFSVPGRG